MPACAFLVVPSRNQAPSRRQGLAGHQLRSHLAPCVAFGDDEGGAFLWRAELTPAAGGYTATIDGMDLILLQGDRFSRNEVYFDRTVLVPSK